MSFCDFALPSWLVRQCTVLGFTTPSPVQSACITPALDGRDILGCAKTGSGKTAAFVLPILTELSKEPFGISTVVLSPTRELACQIVDQISALGKPISIRVALVCGGLERSDQMRQLASKPHIVVATPGRLAEILQMNDPAISIRTIRFLVFDEADRLFEASMAQDMGVIIKCAPSKRQTFLFSATLSPVLQQVLKLAKNQPFQWTEDEQETTVMELDQRYILVPHAVKDTYLVHILKESLESSEGSQIIVFVQTCKLCQTVSSMLHKSKFENAPLNSAMRQRSRLSSIARFKAGQVRILVTTDVGSRGLDIPLVALVVNYTLPDDPDTYIHRVGRTARAGRDGQAISLVSQYDLERLARIEERIGKPVVEMKVDEEEHILPLMLEVNLGRKLAERRLGKSQLLARHDTYRKRKAERLTHFMQARRKTSNT